MCQAFTDAGHKALLLVPNRPDADSSVDDVFAFYGVRGFALTRSVWPGVPGSVYFSALDMARRARAFRAELAYCRFAAGAFATSLAGIPTILETHRPFAHWVAVEQFLFRRVIRSRRFLHLVSISGALQRRFEHDFPALKGRIVVAHDAAEISADDASLPDRKNARLSVGYVGHLYPGKGVELLLPLAQCCGFADFHIVGGEEKAVENLRRDAARIGNLHVHGFLPHPQAQKRIADFDVVLAPYGTRVAVHGDASADISAYMSPLKLFEYMAAGKAIVCSDHEVLQEVIVDEDSALVCGRAKLEEWEKALHRLHADPGLRQRLGAKARQVCRQKYTWSSRVRQVLAGA
jgi:glycosyltransferase involved in cell wall biosynthesis